MQPPSMPSRDNATRKDIFHARVVGRSATALTALVTDENPWSRSTSGARWRASSFVLSISPTDEKMPETVDMSLCLLLFVVRFFDRVAQLREIARPRLGVQLFIE